MKFLIFAAACLTVAYGCEQVHTMIKDCSDAGCEFATNKDDCNKCVANAKEGGYDNCGIPADFVFCAKLKAIVGNLKANPIADELAKCGDGSKQQVCEQAGKIPHKEYIAKASGKMKEERKANKCAEDGKEATRKKYDECKEDTESLKVAGDSCFISNFPSFIEQLKINFELAAEHCDNLKQCILNMKKACSAS